MMGTGPFAVPTFRMLVSSPHDVCLLVTRPPVVSRGRPAPPSPMRLAGEELGVEIYDPPNVNDDSVIAHLQQYEADLLVVCDYGQILSSDALAVGKLGGINLHGSLLPKYRGAAPVQWCVYNGDEVSGISVIHMTPRLDGGPVIAVKSLPVEPDDTSETLETKLSEAGVESVTEAIAKLETWDGHSIIGEVQDPTLATKAPRLQKGMGDVDWSRPATEIRNQIRAFQPWPGSFSQMERTNGKLQKVILDWVEVVPEERTDSLDGFAEFEHGQICLCNKEELWVKTGAGAISITRIQPVGKRVMAIDEFIRGYQPVVGSPFRSS